MAGTVEQQRHIGGAAMLAIPVAADLLQARVVQHVDGDGSVQHMCRHRQLGLACVQLEELTGELHAKVQVRRQSRHSTGSAEAQAKPNAANCCCCC